MLRIYEGWWTRANALDVTVYQRSRTVWIAAGRYRGQGVEVKGRSPKIALALSKEADRCRRGQVVRNDVNNMGMIIPPARNKKSNRLALTEN